MAKFISLRVEPVGGTAFDYLINVDDVISLDLENSFLFLKTSLSLDFPLDAGGSTDAETASMQGFIRDLLLEAKQRPGNAYIAPAQSGLVTITDFA